jgi:hypothetical protein
MRSNRYEQLIRLATGALGLLLVTVVGAPRPAWAGCSHTVSSRLDANLSFNRLDELIDGIPIAQFADERDGSRQRPNREKPCSGLSCSGGVPLPVSRSSQESEGSDQWVALAPTFAVLSFGGDATRSDDPRLRPIGHVDSIFHPPRD